MLDLSKWQVTLDGERGPVFKPSSRSAATLAKGRHMLPNQGISHTAVYALAVVGSDLYVGGHFAETGDGSLTNLGGTARYDTTAGTWHALPKQGVDNVVWALEVSGSGLYVGGKFTQTGDGSLTNLGRVTRYDTTAGAWHALPNQALNWYVFVLAMVDNDLYVGGLFTQTGDGAMTNLGGIARYDIVASTWHALPNQGFSNWVNALLVFGSDLYVAGHFNMSGDGSLAPNHIVRYGDYYEVVLPLVTRQ